jgi:hypothetical protein
LKQESGQACVDADADADTVTEQPRSRSRTWKPYKLQRTTTLRSLPDIIQPAKRK